MRFEKCLSWHVYPIFCNYLPADLVHHKCDPLERLVDPASQF